MAPFYWVEARMVALLGSYEDRFISHAALAVALARQKRHPMKAIATALGVARSNLVVQARREPGASLALGTPRTDPKAAAANGRSSADAELVAQLRPFIDERATYGYRRAAGMLNRQRRSAGEPPVNHKRVYRVLRDAGLLLTRHTGKPTRIHDGKIITLKSDLRLRRLRGSLEWGLEAEPVQ